MLLRQLSGSSRTLFRPQEIPLLAKYLLVGIPSWVKTILWCILAGVVVTVCTFLVRHVSVEVTFH